MSYLVFARKYRPQTFNEILGQDPIVTTLTNAIRQQRIGHAYLFSGPRGTGKTSTARIFAKALNCVEGPTVTPCLSCERCQEIARGSSLDVLEIDGASNRGIDQIRTLRELAKFTPVAGTFKVYIIDEVHQITAEGFNALLKTLEEPPPHVLFILATTAPHKLPATILSRCQRYDFRRLAHAVIVSKLKVIAADEKLELSEEAALGIARAASGSLRDAESILDQVAAFSGGRIGRETLKALLGTIDEEIFAQAMEAIQARDPVRLLKQVAEASNAGTDLNQWAMEFLTFLRNLLMVKVGAVPFGVEELDSETVKRLTALGADLSLPELLAIVQVITSAVETMRRVGEPRIPLEMALVRLASTESMASVAELLERLDELDQKLAASAGFTGTGVPAELTGPVSPSESTPSPGESRATSSLPVSLEQVRAVWPRLLEELHQRKASTAAYLREAAPLKLEEDNPPVLVVGFPKEFDFHRQALDRPEGRTLIQEVLKELLGCALRCTFRTVESIPQAPEGPKASSKTSGEMSQAQAPLPVTAEVPIDPPSEGESAKPDPSLLNSVIDLFEGRLLPGEG